jgi:hypothetical protein
MFGSIGGARLSSNKKTGAPRRRGPGLPCHMFDKNGTVFWLFYWLLEYFLLDKMGGMK